MVSTRFVASPFTQSNSSQSTWALYVPLPMVVPVSLGHQCPLAVL